MVVPAASDPGHLYLGTFRRRWRLTLVTMLVFALAGVVFCLSVPPVYVATAQLTTGSASAPASGGPAAGIEDQISVLTSTPLLARVAAAEHLDDVPEFAPSRPSLLARLVSFAFGRKDSEDEPTPEGIDPKLAPAIGRLQELVHVRRIDGGQVLAIDAASRDRGRAARIANAVASAYLDIQTAVRTADTHPPPSPPPAVEPPPVPSRSLSPDIEAARTEIRTAQDALERALAHDADRMIIPPVPTSRVATPAPREDALRARKNADEKRAAEEKVRRIAEGRADPGTLGRVWPPAAPLSDAYRDITQREHDLRHTLGPRHPTLRDLHDERTRLADQLRQAAQAALPQFERATVKAQPLARSSASSDIKEPRAAPLPPMPPPAPRRDAERSPAAFRHLREVTEAAFTKLLGQSRIATSPIVPRSTPAAIAAPPPMPHADARLISPALAPSKPSFPDPALVIEFCLVTGFLLGLLLSALSEGVKRETPEST